MVGKLFRAIWKAANALSTVQWLFGLLPAGVGAVIAGFAAHGEHLPPVVIWLVAFAAAVICYILWVGLLLHRQYEGKAKLTAPDYLSDALARRKAESVAEVLYPPRDAHRDDGMRKLFEHQRAEAAKRCPETPIWKAVEHVRGIIGDDDLHRCYPEARRQIRQAALEDRLEIWGRREIQPRSGARDAASNAWTRIDPTYWRDHEIGSMAISEHAEERDHTWVEGDIAQNGDRYWSLKVRQPQVERLWHVKQKRPTLVQKVLISNGRDLVQRYRDERMKEPFGVFVAKQRAYLDIQPHLSAEYVQGSIKRHDLRDTPERRDFSAGEFLRELARLEKEWGL